MNHKTVSDIRPLNFNLLIETGVDTVDSGQRTFALEFKLMVKDGIITVDTSALSKTWRAFSLDPDMIGCVRKLCRNMTKLDISELETEEAVIEFFCNHTEFHSVYEYSFDVQLWKIN